MQPPVLRQGMPMNARELWAVEVRRPGKDWCILQSDAHMTEALAADTAEELARLARGFEPGSEYRAMRYVPESRNLATLAGIR